MVNTDGMHVWNSQIIIQILKVKKKQIEICWEKFYYRWIGILGEEDEE